jgi:ComEC/Rec2-related protein
MMVLWWAAFVVVGLFSPPTPFCTTSVLCVTAAVTSVVVRWALRDGRGVTAAPRGVSLGRAVAHCVVGVAAAIVLWEGAGIERRAADARFSHITGSSSTEVERLPSAGSRVSSARSPDDACAPLPPGIAHLRRYLIRSLDRGRLNESAKGIVGAIVLGYRGYLEFDLSERYAYLGVSHFLALSGLHLGVIAVPLAWILSRVVRSRGRRDVALVLTLCLYAAVAAFPPSLSRALALSAAVVAYRLIGLNIGLLGALVGGCFTLVACDPSIAFEAGFQLSVGAVCGIALIGIPLSRMVDAISPGGGRGWLLKLLLFPALITCSVQFLTMPLVVTLFKRASLISPLVNVMVSLPFTVLLYLGVTYVFVPFRPLQTVLAVPINLICRLLDTVPSVLSRGPHPGVYAGDFDCVLYLAGVGFVSLGLRMSGRATVRAATAGVLCVTLSFVVEAGPWGAGRHSAVARKAAEERRVLLGGRGASFVPWEGGVLVIDEGFSRGDAYRFTRKLWGEGVREIELCIVKPPRLARARGLLYVVKRLAVRRVIGSPYLTLSEPDFHHALSIAGSAVSSAARGDTIRTPSFVVTVLGPTFPPPVGACLPADSLRLKCRIVARRCLTSGNVANSMLTVR